jgi:hypothetical protein
VTAVWYELLSITRAKPPAGHLQIRETDVEKHPVGAVDLQAGVPCSTSLKSIRFVIRNVKVHEKPTCRHEKSAQSREGRPGGGAPFPSARIERVSTTAPLKLA